MDRYSIKWSEMPMCVEVDRTLIPLSIDPHAPPSHVFIGATQAWAGSTVALQRCGFTRGDDNVWRREGAWTGR